MKNENSKKLLPYVGMPLLGLALLLMQRTEPFALLQQEILLMFGYVISVSDMRYKKIPNNLVVAMLISWGLTMVPQVFLHTEAALLMLKSAAFGCALGGGLFLFVYFVSRKGLGGGDVKFMAVSGLYLGFGSVLSAMLYGSILAAVVALTLIFLKKIGRKDEIPLAPFLYAGMLITMFFL